MALRWLSVALNLGGAAALHGLAWPYKKGRPDALSWPFVSSQPGSRGALSWCLVVSRGSKTHRLQRRKRGRQPGDSEKNAPRAFFVKTGPATSPGEGALLSLIGSRAVSLVCIRAPACAAPTLPARSTRKSAKPTAPSRPAWTPCRPGNQGRAAAGRFRVERDIMSERPAPCLYSPMGTAE